MRSIKAHPACNRARKKYKYELRTGNLVIISYLATKLLLYFSWKQLLLACWSQGFKFHIIKLRQKRHIRFGTGICHLLQTLFVSSLSKVLICNSFLFLSWEIPNVYYLIYLITSEMLAATIGFLCLLLKQQFIIIAKYTQVSGYQCVKRILPVIKILRTLRRRYKAVF